MDLLIVERRANWSHWTGLTQTLHQPVHVLVSKQVRPPVSFTRAQTRVARPSSPLRRLVVLRAGGAREIALADVHADLRDCRALTSLAFARWR